MEELVWGIGKVGEAEGADKEGDVSDLERKLYGVSEPLEIISGVEEEENG